MFDSIKTDNFKACQTGLSSKMIEQIQLPLKYEMGKLQTEKIELKQSDQADYTQTYEDWKRFFDKFEGQFEVKAEESKKMRRKRREAEEFEEIYRGDRVPSR